MSWYRGLLFPKFFKNSRNLHGSETTRSLETPGIRCASTMLLCRSLSTILQREENRWTKANQQVQGLDKNQAIHQPANPRELRNRKNQPASKSPWERGERANELAPFQNEKEAPWPGINVRSKPAHTPFWLD